MLTVGRLESTSKTASSDPSHVVKVSPVMLPHAACQSVQQQFTRHQQCRHMAVHLRRPQAVDSGTDSDGSGNGAPAFAPTPTVGMQQQWTSSWCCTVHACATNKAASSPRQWPQQFAQALAQQHQICHHQDEALPRSTHNRQSCILAIRLQDDGFPVWQHLSMPCNRQ